MIFKAILNGFTTYFNWYVILATLLYVPIHYLFADLGSRLASNMSFITAPKKKFVAGAFIMFLDFISISCIIAYILPILFGSPEANDISILVANLRPIIRSSVVILIVMSLLIYIKTTRILLFGYVPLQISLAGIMAFRLLAFNNNLTSVKITEQSLPSLFSYVQLVLLLAVITFVSTLIYGLICIPFMQKDSIQASIISNNLNKLERFKIIASFVNVTTGFLMIYIYAAYINLSL